MPRIRRLSVLVALIGVVVVGLLACDEATETSDPEGDDDAEAFASATWKGEEVEFNDVSCRIRPGFEVHELTASGDEINLNFAYSQEMQGVEDDPEENLDLTLPDIQLVVNETSDNETARYTQMGETFDATPEAGRFDDGELFEIQGTVELDPQSGTAADPDGGTLEFNVGC